MPTNRGLNAAILSTGGIWHLAFGNIINKSFFQFDPDKPEFFCVTQVFH